MRIFARTLAQLLPAFAVFVALLLTGVAVLLAVAPSVLFTAVHGAAVLACLLIAGRLAIAALRLWLLRLSARCP